MKAENKQASLNPPKPITCDIENGVGQATFDHGELKRFVEKTTLRSFAVEDEDGNLIGIAHTDFIRELFSEKGGGHVSHFNVGFPFESKPTVSE
jgi:hypothetical protein